MAREEVQAREVVPGRKEGLAREEDQKEKNRLEGGGKRWNWRRLTEL